MEQLREITQQNLWKFKIDDLINNNDFTSNFKKQFRTYWTEAGHRIREQVQDDEKLINFLRIVLPGYDGKKIRLYRGENIERYNHKKIGLLWTPKIEVATMFASGLNAINSGGLLLMSEVPSNIIISGPSDHSIYLGETEYTIDILNLNDINIIKEFPPTYIKT